MNRFSQIPRRTVLLGFVALLIPATLLFAGSRSGAGFGGRHFSGFHGESGILHRVAEKLDLSDEQKSGIHDVFKAHRTEMREVMDKVRAARQEQMAAIHGDTFDESAIRAAAAKVAAGEADMAVMRGKIASEIREILTPEQRVKAKELLKDAEAFRSEMFNRFHQRLGEGPFGGDS